MNQIILLCADIKSQWQTLVTTRAGEGGQLDGAIGESNSFAHYTSAIQAWHTKLSTFSKLPKKRLLGTAQLRASLAHSFGAIKFALNHMNNGVQWMIDQRALSVLLVLAESQMDVLEREIQRERSVQVEAAKAELADNLDLISSSAVTARDFLQKSDDLKRTACTAHEMIEAAIASKAALDKEYEVGIARIATLYADAEKENKDSRANLLKEIAQIKSKADQSFIDLNTLVKEKREAIAADTATLDSQILQAKELFVDISGFHSRALKVSTDATTAKDSADADIAKALGGLADAEKKQDAAKFALNAALQNVRRQGLSGAFFEKVVEVKSQRAAEQKQFQFALVYLATIGVLGLVLELTQGLPTSFDQWLIRFVRLVVLAAPGVWIAWLAAKRLEALNRVLSDYEYKSATALAFESYRQEIETSGNSDLKEELLRRAIITFGENPTRYYDSSKDVSVMPVESLLERAKGMFPNQTSNEKDLAKMPTSTGTSSS